MAMMFVVVVKIVISQIHLCQSYIRRVLNCLKLKMGLA